MKKNFVIFTLILVLLSACAIDPYTGETKVVHYLELLRDTIGFDQIKKSVTNPLKGKKIGAYYGCLLLRPGKVMQMDNPENPTIMEDLISSLGATPVKYALTHVLYFTVLSYIS